VAQVEIDREAQYLIARDNDERSIGVSITPAGEVMFSTPVGLGRVRRLLQTDRHAARAFARGILELLGDDDQ
jgi:hypothetical protein